MAEIKGDNFILQKVKNHPELKGLTEDEQMLQARELTSHDSIKCQFSYLLETGSRLILETAREDDDGREFLATMEELAAHQKAKQDVAQTCHLPVKLILSKLRRGRPPLANTWSSIFKFEYGPLHAALQVGEVLIEWGRESLVIPKFEPILPGRELQFHVHGQGEWRETAGQFVREMSIVHHHARRNTAKRVDVLYRSVTEKNRLIENLIEVIIKYNREYKYDLIKRNCQHFVRDAMAALGIKETLQFSGKLAEYYELLKDGKTKMPEFKTHDCVDKYVRENFDRLSQHDMEFLLCQYFRHHYAEMSEADNIDEWKCTLPNCQSDRIEDQIKQNSLLFNQFEHDDRQLRLPSPTTPRRHRTPSPRLGRRTPSPRLGRRTPSPRFGRQAAKQKKENTSNDRLGDKVAEMFISEPLPARTQPQSIVVTTSLPTLVRDRREQDKEEELPQEFLQGVNLARQDSLLGKFRGYRECIAFKLRTHPDYMDETQVMIDSLVNIHGESEQFRINYFNDDLCTCQDLTTKMVDDFKVLPSLPREEAQARVRKNFVALSSFPLKFLYHPISQGPSFGRGNVLDVPSEVRLQVGQYEFDWNVVGLVIPKLVQAKHFQPVFSVCPMVESKWSTFVREKRSMIEEAIQNMDTDLQTELIFEFIRKRDELLKAVIDVIIDYNRHKEYDEKRLANSHFVADICKTIGLPPTATVESLQHFNKSQYDTRHFTSHLQLDNFVIDLNWDNKTASLPQVDIQYLIAKYFHFHVVEWEDMKRPDHWTCTAQNCQLLELEKLSH